MDRKKLFDECLEAQDGICVVCGHGLNGEGHLHEAIAKRGDLPGDNRIFVKENCCVIHAECHKNTREVDARCILWLVSKYPAEIIDFISSLNMNALPGRIIEALRYSTAHLEDNNLTEIWKEISSDFDRLIAAVKGIRESMVEYPIPSRMDELVDTLTIAIKYFAHYLTDADKKEDGDIQSASNLRTKETVSFLTEAISLHLYAIYQAGFEEGTKSGKGGARDGVFRFKL